MDRPTEDAKHAPATIALITRSFQLFCGPSSRISSPVAHAARAAAQCGTHSKTSIQFVTWSKLHQSNVGYGIQCGSCVNSLRATAARKGKRSKPETASKRAAIIH